MHNRGQLPHPDRSTVNKSELVTAVAGHTDTDPKVVAVVLNGIEDVIVAVVKKGNDKVVWTGFVGFEQVARKARRGRNPATGESIRVKAKKAPRVSLGAGFKKVVAGEVAAPKITTVKATATKATAAKKTTARASTAKAAGAKATAVASAPVKAASRRKAAAPAAKKAPTKRTPVAAAAQAPGAASSRIDSTKAPAAKASAKRAAKR
jgi:DNA-binding protein HU-beta